MDRLSGRESLREQYRSPHRLERRISLHEKYSVNPQGFGPWVVSHYHFLEGARVLELGCGTGSMWQRQEELIRRCGELVLTDLSEGMVSAARASLGDRPPLRFQTADIRALPFPDGAFDVCIANMMLYHVPEPDLALAEVRRVLRPAGCFYAATYGEHGIVERLCQILAPLGLRDGTGKRFTLQNGAARLRRFFPEVRRFDYPDSLRVTDPEDLIDYLCSLPSMEEARRLPRDRIRALLRAEMRNGVLELPKEYGLFAAKAEDA